MPSQAYLLQNAHVIRVAASPRNLKPAVLLSSGSPIYSPSMLDFDQTMLLPTLPLSISSSDILGHSTEQSKDHSNHVYYRQQHTVQIIQLVEGPPPTPRHISSVINDSSASSTSSDAYSSEYSESCPSQEDEESVCSSYCSSDSPSEQPDLPHCEEGSSSSKPESSSESYTLRMKRIMAWRENFSTHLSATLSGKCSPHAVPEYLTHAW